MIFALHPAALPIFLLGLAAIGLLFSVLRESSARKSALEVFFFLAIVTAMAFIAPEPTTPSKQQVGAEVKPASVPILEECSRVLRDESALSVPTACVNR
jgi:hypothetical protein